MNPIDLLIAPAHAAAAAPAGGSMLSALMFPILLIAIMYFLLIRPQMKRNKEHRAMLEKLSVGDEVRSIGDSFITVEISERVEIRVQKGAIGNVLPKGTLKSA